MAERVRPLRNPAQPDCELPKAASDRMLGRGYRRGRCRISSIHQGGGDGRTGATTEEPGPTRVRAAEGSEYEEVGTR